MKAIDTSIATIARQFARFRADESAATAIEYALIAAGVGVAVSTTVYALGSNVKGLFTKIAGLMP